MHQISLLIFLCVSMLIGSFLSGTVPLAFRLSDSRSRLLALMGSGILVGTALAVIIPEGISSLFPTSNNEQTVSNSDDVNVKKYDKNQEHTDIAQDSVQDNLRIIGPSLVIGFVLMLLIDQFSMYLAGDSHDHNTNPSSHSLSHSYSLTRQDDDDLSNSCEDEVDTSSKTNGREDKDTKSNHHRVTMTNVREYPQNNVQFEEIPIDLELDRSNYSNYENNSHSRYVKPKVTPTLGLVIHAAADGIALGAAATTAHRQVELIIFLAIMLHKAPAAFSLVVFLLHMGLKHSTVKKHLLAFSLSAPLAALVTYLGLSQSSKEALRQNNATGVAMLFSAGTFLYVATVHVLPELIQNKILKRSELLCLVGGSFLPILLAQTV